MSAIKNSKFWSTLALVWSLLSILTMAAIMLGYFGDNFSFREASGYIRSTAQVSAFVLGLCVIVALFSWKNKASLIKAVVAIAIVFAPLMLLKNNMPEGTSLFGAARSGPPPGARAKKVVTQEKHPLKT